MRKNQGVVPKRKDIAAPVKSGKDRQELRSFAFYSL
jgi:hypothetical protein